MTAAVQLRNDLFLRGAERYLDALAAVKAFEREVQRTCTEVYQRHAAELAEQMGLDAAECEQYIEPEPEERYAEVGVSRLAQKDCGLYLYLSWDETEGGKPRVQGAICLGLYHKGLRDKIYERFRQENPRCRVTKYDKYQLMLTSLMKPDELGSAGKILDDLVLEWLGYCKAAGGLGLKKYKTP
jgi:hypothetical protein